MNTVVHLQVGNKVAVPIEFWKYATEIVNQNVESKCKKIWEVSPATKSSVEINGSIKWLGTLSETRVDDYQQRFAEIETVSRLYNHNV